MSVRLLTTRLLNHGRYFLQGIWKREIHINILEQNQIRARSQRYTAPSGFPRPRSAVASRAQNARQAINAALNSSASAGQVTQSASANARGIFRFGQHARKLFVDNVLSRCTTTYSQQLRDQAMRKLFFGGDSVPFFALIGVSLASGAGVLTKEDELEGVCWEIREAASRLQSSWNYDEISDTFVNNDFNIDKLNVGPAIAKGCAAVVYAACFKADQNSRGTVERGAGDHAGIGVDAEPVGKRMAISTQREQQMRPELMSPIQNISRFVHNFGGSVDNLNAYSRSTSGNLTFMAERPTPTTATNEMIEGKRRKEQDSNSSMNSIEGLQGIQAGLQETSLKDDVTQEPDLQRFPLALKMMFNYDIQSNAMHILRAMYRETVPARQRYLSAESGEWERLLQEQTLVLPPHPNIVCMYGFFCDEVRNFPDGHLLYPVAQPPRLNPHGYGRNMSLYLLMKRYDNCLRDLLDSTAITTRTKILLLAQLLEAVAHINRHGIAHRDIKADNILIEFNDDGSSPVLVLSDFGCCLADKAHGLQLPYTSLDIDKGGNAALMAPEIIKKQPGPFAVLNYAKADLWACGAIAYEIFGLPNPFYASPDGSYKSLRNSDYKAEDLPPLSEECPALVQQLIYNILEPNPSKRMSPDIAANVMQLYLWAPSKWLKSGGMPNSSEILQWLLSLSTKLMCEGRAPDFQQQRSLLQFKDHGRRTYVEYLLICSFLSRSRLRRIRGALNWIQSTVA